ncbi:hypothetical protein, partial [Bacillus cereus]|uniref:hypothetical protein n=1 Tax=Bacillus cereus TaxID=1396 RepID=UPI001EE6E720
SETAEDGLTWYKQWQDALFIVQQIVNCYLTICHDHFTTHRMYVQFIIHIYRNGGETNDYQ